MLTHCTTFFFFYWVFRKLLFSGNFWGRLGILITGFFWDFLKFFGDAWFMKGGNRLVVGPKKRDRQSILDIEGENAMGFYSSNFCFYQPWLNDHCFFWSSSLLCSALPFFFSSNSFCHLLVSGIQSLESSFQDWVLFGGLVSCMKDFWV